MSYNKNIFIYACIMYKNNISKEKNDSQNVTKKNDI